MWNWGTGIVEFFKYLPPIDSTSFPGSLFFNWKRDPGNEVAIDSDCSNFGFASENRSVDHAIIL